MVLPFAPNSGAAESQVYNERLQDSDPTTNIATQQDDILASHTSSKLNSNDCPAPDSGNHYSQHYQPSSTIWALYLKETEAEDKELAQLWQIGLDQLLIFAGLFGAILTAFLIESRKDLKEDPLEAILYAIRQVPTPQPFRPVRSSLIVNGVWFCSLGLTLISALAAVLAKGWLAKYTPATPGIRSYDACERHLRYLRAQQWRLGIIVGGIPFLIQIALFLFAVGLVTLMFGDNLGIGISLLVLLVLSTALYIFFTFLPWFSPACPFQTAVSDFIPGIAMNPRYPDKRKPSALSKPFSQQWKGFTEFLREARRKPEQLEIEADILAWLLTNSTTEEALEEAVKAVAGANANNYLPDALDKYGASSVLNERLTGFLKIAPGLPITVVDEMRAEAYLYAMLRTVESFNEADQNKALLMEDSVQLGKFLYRWEDYTDYLRPLAFSMRMKVMLATGRDEDGPERERSKSELLKMAGMGMTLYVRWVLLNATVQGLLEGKPEIRKMSGQVLGKLLQNSDTNNMLGEGDRADRVISAMIRILKENTDMDILEAVMRMARCSRSRPSMDFAISEIVNLLKHDKWDIRCAAANALSKLSEQAQLRRSITTAMLEIVNFLKDSETKVRLASARALWNFSEQAEFRPLIIAVIPEIVTLLKDSEFEVRSACATALSIFSKQAEFRDLIAPAVLSMVESLVEGDSNVRVAYADALSQLSQRAEFRTSIATAIPEIVSLLKDSESRVRVACAKALSTFSEHAEFRSSIGTAIPVIVDFLKDSDEDVRQGGACALSELSGHAEFRPLMETALTEFVRLLKDSDSSVRVPCMKALSKLSEHAEFRHVIETVIPEIIQLITDDDWDARQNAAGALLTLSNHVELRPLIGTSIPGIAKLLTDSKWTMTEFGAEALSKLSEQAEIRHLIDSAIPDVVNLLKQGDRINVVTLLETLSNLSAHTEFHPLIGPTIPGIIDLVKDSDGFLRWLCVRALTNFSKQAALQHLIRPAIPRIVNLFDDRYPNLAACAGTLLGFLPGAENRDAIRNAIWSTTLFQGPLRSLGNHRNDSSSHTLVRHLGANLKAELVDHVSSVDRVVQLLHYWSSSDRFLIFDGVRILVDLAYVAQMCDSQILAHLFTLCDDNHLISLLDIVLKLNKHGKFLQSIDTAIPEIVNILKNGDNLDVRMKCADALSKLLDKNQIRPSMIRTAIPDIVNLLKESRSHDSFELSEQTYADTLLTLSKQAEFRPLIEPAIPGIVNLLKNDDGKACQAGAYALLKLSGRAEFQSLIGTTIPEIVNLLKRGDRRIYEAGADILSELAKQTEFQPSIIHAIPQVVGLLKDSNRNVGIACANALSTLSAQAEFRHLIGPAIPEIIDLLLKDRDWGGYSIDSISSRAFSRLSKQAEFQHSIGAAIPGIINLLDDNDSDVRLAGADALSQLLEQAEFRPLIGSAPGIINLLNDSNWRIRVACANAMSVLSEEAEFRHLIEPAVPEIVNLLQDSNWTVRDAGTNTLVQLSSQVEFQSSVAATIPEIVNLLEHNDEEVREAGAETLSNLLEQTELQHLIGPAIPRIVKLLKDSEWGVCLASSLALSTISEQPESRHFIDSAIPGIICLLKDSEWQTRSACAMTLSRFSLQADFRHWIGPAIPEIINLLKDNNNFVREASADALLQFWEQDYCLQDVFPTIISILLSPEADLYAVPICTRIFASHAFNEFFRDRIVKILIFTFDCLYVPDGSRRTRGLKVIQVLAEYATFAPILHEIWAIYSFARDTLSITRLEDIRFFVEQMHIHGVLKSI